MQQPYLSIRSHRSTRRFSAAVARPKALAVALSLATAPVAIADESSTDPSIETVTVYGTGYRTTGTKSDLLPSESPMSFEIYDNELLELRQVDSVNEALRYVPGITTESRATATLFDQYNIRGFDSYYNYYNGLPLQYNRSWNLVPQVDAFATQSIEVLKGPTSVLYGSAPPGGMINQTAKQPQSAQSTRVRVRGGTSSLVELGVDSTGALSNNVDYRLIALGRTRDGQQQTTEEERYLLAPSVTWNISNDTSLNLNAYYQDDPKAIPSTTLPSIGTLYEAPYGKLDADAYAGDANWNLYDRTVTMLGYKLSHDFSESVTFLQNFRYTDAEGLQRNTYGYGGLAEDGRTYYRTAYYTDETNEGIAVDNQLSIDFQSGDIRHNLLVGLDYQELDSDIDYGDDFGVSTPPIDLADPDYHLINPEQLSLTTYQYDIAQEQLGLYIQDEIHWQDLTVILGTRWDDYDGSTDTSGNVTEVDQQELSSRAAAIYTFDSGIAPYIGYSESYEPQSGQDSLTGEAFEPTTADQWEVGVKYNVAGTAFTAAVYDLRKQNVVVRAPSGEPFQQTQNGEVTSRGLELSATLNPTENLEVSATYNVQDVEVTDNPLNTALLGKTPTWVAEQQATLWASYFASNALTVSGGIRHVGEQQVDDLNTDTVPSYTLLDLVATYDFNNTYDVSLSANNVTDKRYVSSCSGTSRCWMGTERSVELTVNARF